MELKLVVVLVASFLLLHLFNFAYRYFVRPGKKLVSTYGKWAMVTGATDGIGAAISMELARKGCDIILVSRSLSKLDATAVDIKNKYPTCQTRQLQIDFSNFNEDAKQRVASVLREVEVGILVNNVGMSYDFPDNFHALSPQQVQQLIDLNVTSSCQMTYLSLPLMVSRGRGLVVFTSSASSLVPNPLLAAYSAAKAYVDQFARSLSFEYERNGIAFQTQNPLYVKTKMAKMSASLTVPTATQYARAAVASFGYERQISPYWLHGLMLSVVSWLPDFVVGHQVLGMHIAIKKRALKKREAASAQKKD